MDVTRAQPVVPPPPAAVRRAVAAVYWVFFASGLAFASLAGRIPQLKSRLDVSPGALGLILLCTALGAIVAMPASGVVIARAGEARTVAAMSCVLVAGLALVGIGYRIGVAPVALGLFLLGFGNGGWDVAMNVQGAAVERAFGRSIMSRFHAGYSIGTVAGAGVGAAMVALHVPVTGHLLAAAAVVLASVPAVATRGFLPHAAEQHAHESRRAALAAWREPRTVLIGVFVLCMAFAEGTGNDWLSLGVIDGYHTTPVTGTVTLAIFLAAMTAGRWFGPGLLDRYGRVRVLRTCALTAVAGLLVVVFGRSVPAAMAGAVLWGLGTSLGFPTGMSAAADDPARAPARVSVAASIAYTAFLAGPPLLGFAGDHLGVLRALTVAGALLAVASMITGVTRPLPGGAAD